MLNFYLQFWLFFFSQIIVASCSAQKLSLQKYYLVTVRCAFESHRSERNCYICQPSSTDVAVEQSCVLSTAWIFNKAINTPPRCCSYGHIRITAKPVQICGFQIIIADAYVVDLAERTRIEF